MFNLAASMALINYHRIALRYWEAVETAQRLAIGLCLRGSTHRFDKSWRGNSFFSHVAANLSADRESVTFCPYRILIQSKGE